MFCQETISSTAVQAQDATANSPTVPTEMRQHEETCRPGREAKTYFGSYESPSVAMEWPTSLSLELQQGLSTQTNLLLFNLQVPLSLLLFNHISLDALMPRIEPIASLACTLAQTIEMYPPRNKNYKSGGLGSFGCAMSCHSRASQADEPRVGRCNGFRDASL